MRAGIWRYDPTRLHQVHDVAQRFATGIRNAVGLAWSPGLHALYATQHGRDALHDSYPKLYSVEKSDDTPSEELLKVEAGGDYGWPYCYHDRVLRRLVLAPEYGGDANKAGRCADKKLPVLAFPGHWAPDGFCSIRARSSLPATRMESLSPSTGRGTGRSRTAIRSSSSRSLGARPATAARFLLTVLRGDVRIQAVPGIDRWGWLRDRMGRFTSLTISAGGSGGSSTPERNKLAFGPCFGLCSGHGGVHPDRCPRGKSRDGRSAAPG